MNKRKIAVFDIDGTLYRWQLFHELVEELTIVDVFPSNTFRSIDSAWNDWRGGTISFHSYEMLVVETLLKYLPLIPVTTFEAACDKVVEQSGHKLHAFPKALIADLKARGYVIAAISGSQQELLDRFGKRHGLDLMIGALYERQNGHFTGKELRRTVGHKAELLQRLIQEHNLTMDESVGIGDSDGDIDLLAVVAQPIAFNPSEGLFQAAKDNRWPIVIERKNIAYKMEHRGDSLILAETIIY